MWFDQCRVESVVKESLFTTRLGKTITHTLPVALLITMACLFAAENSAHGYGICILQHSLFSNVGLIHYQYALCFGCP